LNPDEEFVRDLIRGLLENEKRYGYEACPCRLASGVEEQDRDIQCPCDYRDRDLSEFGQCYCALCVSEAVVKDPKCISCIPERRGTVVPAVRAYEAQSFSGLTYPVWRCSVCGYLCARDEPPLACPICKARKERFTRFL
jgi:ferredoxin-thioredoxin reductase catalytic chain